MKEREKCPPAEAGRTVVQDDNTNEFLKISGIDILEPVVFGGELGWLVKEKKKVGRELSEISARAVLSGEDNQPIQEIWKYTILPQNAWRCLKCGALIISSRKEKPPLECYENQGGCGRRPPSVLFGRVTGEINPDIWKIPEWRDIPIGELNMKEGNEKCQTKKAVLNG